MHKIAPGFVMLLELFFCFLSAASYELAIFQRMAKFNSAGSITKSDGGVIRNWNSKEIASTLADVPWLIAIVSLAPVPSLSFTDL